MNIFYLSDMSTIATMVASAFTASSLAILTSKQPPKTWTWTKNEFLRQSIIYCICTIAGTCILSWCIGNLAWQDYTKLGRSHDMRALIPLGLNWLLSLLCVLPAMLWLQFRTAKSPFGQLFKTKTCNSQKIYEGCVLAWLIAISLPLVQFILILSGFSLQAPHDIRDLVRIGFGEGHISLLFAMAIIAFHKTTIFTKDFSHVSKRLEVNDVSSIACKSDEELNYLIAVALRAEKLETADKISIHLLQRIEREL